MKVWFTKLLPRSNEYPFTMKYIHSQFMEYYFNLSIASTIILMDFAYSTLWNNHSLASHIVLIFNLKTSLTLF